MNCQRASFFVLGIFILAFTFNFLFAHTALAIPGRDFGGRIVFTGYYCVNGIDLFIAGPLTAPQMTGFYLFPWGAILYKWWQPIVGNNVVGQVFPGGCCWVPTAVGPICLPELYTITSMGTSGGLIGAIADTALTVIQSQIQNQINQ